MWGQVALEYKPLSVLTLSYAMFAPNFTNGEMVKNASDPPNIISITPTFLLVPIPPPSLVPLVYG